MKKIFTGAWGAHYFLMPFELKGKSRNDTAYICDRTQLSPTTVLLWAHHSEILLYLLHAATIFNSLWSLTTRNDKNYISFCTGAEATRTVSRSKRKRRLWSWAQAAVTLTKSFTTRSTATEIQKYRYKEMSETIQRQASFEWIQETDESEAWV